MRDDVVWWRWTGDGATHAIPRDQIGHGHPMLTTACGLSVEAWRVDRDDSAAPWCLACRVIHRERE